MNHNINHFQRNTKSDINIFFNTNKNENKLLNYEIGKIIGKGAYATVKICTNKITQEKFAMKIQIILMIMTKNDFKLWKQSKIIIMIIK